MQIALFVPTVRKMKNHRHSLHKLIFILLFLLTFSAVFNQCLSVIFQFLLSASRVLFSARLYLKRLFFIVTATFCSCHALYFSHCLPLQFTLYSLPESLSDVSLGFYGVGFLAFLPEGGGFALAKSEGVC